MRSIFHEYFFYPQGFIDKERFIQDSRPPSNFEDYQPLIDFCKENKLGVLASNCPRRYTRIVSQNGREHLEELVKAVPNSANFLPPIPYEGASEKYRDNFIQIMRQMGNDNPNVPTKMLDAQSLWDATMAHSISEVS